MAVDRNGQCHYDGRPQDAVYIRCDACNALLYCNVCGEECAAGYRHAGQILCHDCIPTPPRVDAWDLELPA